MKQLLIIMALALCGCETKVRLASTGNPVVISNPQPGQVLAPDKGGVIRNVDDDFLSQTNRFTDKRSYRIVEREGRFRAEALLYSGEWFPVGHQWHDRIEGACGDRDYSIWLWHNPKVIKQILGGPAPPPRPKDTNQETPVAPIFECDVETLETTKR